MRTNESEPDLSLVRFQQPRIKMPVRTVKLARSRDQHGTVQFLYRDRDGVVQVQYT